MSKVRMTPAGLDGNADALLGAFRREARDQGWADDAIEAVAREAPSADYARLVATPAEHTTGDREAEDV